MDKRIEKAYDLIKRNFKTKLLLKDLANEVGISPFHFQKLFKAELGVSPIQCIMRIRLERARHLLHIDPTMSMATVANDCGFSSLAVFSRAFSSFYGIQAKQMAHRLRQQISTTMVEPFPVEIVYLSEVRLLYEHTNMYRKNLSKDFAMVQERARNSNISIHPKRIGVLTHIAFHGPKDNLNYYAGFQLVGQVPSKLMDKVFSIPGGKYAAFRVEGEHHKLMESMLQFKRNWLDHSKYIIRDIFAFEEFLETGENNSSRMVYIPLKSKK